MSTKITVKADNTQTLIGAKSKTYFDDAQIGSFTGLAQKRFNVVTGLIDDYTGEAVTFSKVTGVTDADVDGVMIRKKGSEYFKRNVTGGINVKWFGAIGDGVADDTSAIKNAIKIASYFGANLLIPKTSAFYKVIPATSMAGEGGTTTVAFPMKSNMHILSEIGATIKMADSQSTDVSPKRLSIFFTNTPISNVSFKGLTIDGNGANNTISPSRPATYNVDFNQGMIEVSGTIGGVAARMDNVVIENCTFQNNAGVCCIVAGQSNTAGTQLGSNWTIRNNSFLNNGTDTADHTSIFAWVDNMLCENNIFTTASPVDTIGKTGGVTAYEVHGSNHLFSKNYIKNYYRGVWISSNLTATEVTGTKITNNTFDFCAFYGIDVFRTSSTLSTIKGATIENNTFNVDDYTFSGAPTVKACINVACEYAVFDIKASGNKAYKTGTNVGSVFFAVSPQTISNQAYDGIVCENNEATGFVTGASIKTNSTNGLGYVALRNNKWINNTPSTSFTVPIGNEVVAVGQIKAMHISNNMHIDTRTSPVFKYGNYIGGSFNYLDAAVSNDSYFGITLANFLDNGITALSTPPAGAYVDLSSVQAIGGVKTFSSLIASSVSSGEVLRNITGGNNALGFRLKNTVNDTYFGIEGSSAGGFFTGSAANNAVIYSGQPIQMIVNQVARLTASASGINVNGSASAKSFLGTVVAVTDAATVTLDVSTGSTFRWTLGGNRTIAAPTNPTDGQKIKLRLIQDVTGSRTITWNAAFRFSTTYPSPTLTTTPGLGDFIEFIYTSADSKWDCIRIVQGVGTAL